MKPTETSGAIAVSMGSALAVLAVAGLLGGVAAAPDGGAREGAQPADTLRIVRLAQSQTRTLFDGQVIAHAILFGAEAKSPAVEGLLQVTLAGYDRRTGLPAYTRYELQAHEAMAFGSIITLPVAHPDPSRPQGQVSVSLRTGTWIDPGPVPELVLSVP